MELAPQLSLFETRPRPFGLDQGVLLRCSILSQESKGPAFTLTSQEKAISHASRKAS